jgi:hypothetical protein
MSRQFTIVVHTAYDDLYPVDSWSREADYNRARNFLKALVGGPHGVSRDRYAGSEIYEISTRAQADAYRRFKQELEKTIPERELGALLRAPTSLHVYCCFDGISMSLPFGSVENYRLASALASQLTGPAGRAVAGEDEIFYLKTREQLDALFALQRKLKVKRNQA